MEDLLLIKFINNVNIKPYQLTINIDYEKAY